MEPGLTLKKFCLLGHFKKYRYISDRRYLFRPRNSIQPNSWNSLHFIECI